MKNEAENRVKKDEIKGTQTTKLLSGMNILNILKSIIKKVEGEVTALLSHFKPCQNSMKLISRKLIELDK